MAERMFILKRYVCFIITGIILFCAVFLSSNFEMKSDNLMASSSETKLVEERYVLKTQNGRLAVFKQGGNTPFIVTETMVENLPKEDQKNLENGIEVLGDTDLRKALEDYCS